MASAARRARWALLLAAVLVVHGSGLLWIGDQLVGWGSGSQPMPARIEVEFVKALTPAAPPAAPPPRAARPAPVRQAPVAQPAASAPLPAQPEPLAEAASAPLPPTPVPPAAAVAEAAPAPTEVSSAVAPPSASAPVTAAAPSFEWPPSTRLTYTLVGNYRGEVNGRARVQWVRVGSRYQVHLDVEIGPSFAPLMSRRMTSDGDIGEHGLMPRRYDEQTKLPFQSARRATVEFTPGQVTLANGSTRAAPPEVQDTASQFVQLTWLFTTQPAKLRQGEAITVPLALPRRVDRWVYDVVGQEKLSTPAGELDTFHLKPRRAETRPRGELSIEVWFAPSLQYLPARIRIHQDLETFVDLMVDAAPMQAEPEERPR